MAVADVCISAVPGSGPSWRRLKLSGSPSDLKTASPVAFTHISTGGGIDPSLGIPGGPLNCRDWRPLEAGT